jgi:metal-responsive CopG/Arc/MetJ family transcriptional regulator
MRTTIELPDELRAELVALAARRGEKGYSRIVQEAVVQYLAGQEGRVGRMARARSAIGTLGADEADSLEAAAAQVRRQRR